MAKPQTQQDYWDMGADTERWWREHIRPHPLLKAIKHTPKCRGYDFMGKFEEHTFYIDTKFLTVPYREKGWIEIKTWGKVTGIMQTGKEHFNNPNASVYPAIMTEGEFYLYDVKAIIHDIQAGILPLNKGTCIDNMGNETASVSVKMDGWNDSRYRAINGPLHLKHWKPQTAFGKGMDMDKWFKGEGI
jgi:hypothetical protein